MLRRGTFLDEASASTTERKGLRQGKKKTFKYDDRREEA